MGSAMEILNSGNTHKIKQAEIEGKRITQAAYNEREAATTSLQRFAQSLGNQRKLDAMGKEFNARTQNIGAALDAAVTGTFQQRLAAAAELGAVTVMANSAGVGGGSVEAYRRTLNLRNAIQEEGQERAKDNNVINAVESRNSVIGNTVAALENNDFSPSFDYTIYLDHIEQKNKVGAAIAIGVASYFGGAQGGMAASDAIASGNRSANGDTAGSNRLLGSAAGNAGGAYQYYQANAFKDTPTQTASGSGNVAQGFRASDSGVRAGSGFWGSGDSSGYSYNIK